MKDNLEIFFNTPWKLFHEILMYLFKPFVLIYLEMNGVKIGKGSKFYGFPKIYKHRNSLIKIGDNFECRSWWFSNPLGVNHPTIICTWQEGAQIKIGDGVGVTGGSIVAAKNITIGNRVLIGVNSTIIDTDFHPVNSRNRRYQKVGIKCLPVEIGNNVFIGMNSIVLKGVKVSNDEIVPAGNVLVAGRKI